MLCFTGASSLIAAVLAQQQQQQENLVASPQIGDGTTNTAVPLEKIKSEHSSSSMLLLQPQVSNRPTKELGII